MCILPLPSVWIKRHLSCYSFWPFILLCFTFLLCVSWPLVIVYTSYFSQDAKQTLICRSLFFAFFSHGFRVLFYLFFFSSFSFSITFQCHSFNLLSLFHSSFFSFFDFNFPFFSFKFHLMLLIFLSHWFSRGEQIQFTKTSPSLDILRNI